MTKIRLNQTLLFLLITAFLAMQWSTAHIHLAEYHDHDGSQHQHSIEAHAHQQAGHHADSIDSPHQSADLNIVELDPPYSSSTGKNKTPHTSAITAFLWPLSLPQSVSIELPIVLNTKLSFFDRSTVKLRAPPRLV